MDLPSHGSVYTTSVLNDYRKWGRLFWHTMHLSAQEYAEHAYSEDNMQKEKHFLEVVIARKMPCEDCVKHYRAYLKAHAPPLHTPAAMPRWVYDFHNAVNDRKIKEGKLKVAANGACILRQIYNPPLLSVVCQSVPIPAEMVIVPTYEEVMRHYTAVSKGVKIRGHDIAVPSLQGKVYA